MPIVGALAQRPALRRAPAQRPPRAALRAPSLVGGRPDLLAPTAPVAAFSTPFQPTVQFAYGADLAADPGSWLWTDVTVDLYDNDQWPGIQITARGRADEASQTQPCEVQFTFANQNGQHTPRNPFGVNYPNVRQNVPIRCGINAGDGVYWRAWVYANSFTPGWDDILNVATVTVSASGIMRQLGQGKALRSVLYRDLAGQSNYFGGAVTQPQVPIWYWPFEDDAGATSAAEFSGGPSLSPSGTATWAADSQLETSAPLPTVATGTTIAANVPAYTSAGGWSVICALSVPAAPVSTVTLLDVTTTGTVPRWRVTLSPVLDVLVQAFNASGTEVLGALPASFPSERLGKPVVLQLEAHQDGADVSASATVVAPVPVTSVFSSSTATTSGFILSFTTPTVTAARFTATADLNGSVFGHLAIHNLATPVDVLPLTSISGWVYETPPVRFQRICAEEGIAATIPGRVSEFALSFWSQALGVQPIAGVLDVFRECEAVGGLLSDGLRPGLTFLPQVVHPISAGGAGARYNRQPELVLDMAKGHLSPPFEPIEDDQRRRNDWTVSRSAGASAGSSGRSQDTDGPEGVATVGRYADQTSVSLVQDTGLVSQAGWRVHLGTVPEMRYPQVAINLRRDTELISSWRQCDLGSRITIQNPPSQHAPGDIDQIIEGYSESLRTFEWTATLNVSPFRPWEVQVVEDPRLGRLDTGGSQLAASASAAAGSLSVATTNGPLWTTTATFPADFPMDIEISGIRIRVTAIVGSSSPQTFTVDSSTVTKALSIGSAVNIWRPGAIAL